MLTEIQKNLKPYLKKGQTLITGVSGGPDSICLLHILHKLQNKFDIHLIAAHLDHQLRGKESKKDAIFTEKFAKKLKIPCEVEKIDIQKLAKRRNLEETGRMERYKFLRKLKEKHHADWIVTAHHLDDNIETVFMNLIRGCGMSGLTGMTVQNNDLLRPMLTIRKEQILQYLKKNTIPYRIDRSNLNKKFTRNFLRLEIIPMIKKINPEFEKTFLKNQRYFMEFKNFISESTKKWLKTNTKMTENFIKISLKKWLKTNMFFQKELLKTIYIHFHESTQGLESKHIEEIQKLLYAQKTGKQKRFGKCTAYIMYDHVEFRKTPFKNTSIPLKTIKIPGTTKISSFFTVKTTFPKHTTKNLKDPTKIFLDADKIQGNIFVRSWQKGDKITPLGLRGNKKVHDIFIDKKIPREERHQIPVFLDEKKIIAVGNNIISDRYKITEKTKTVLKIMKPPHCLEILPQNLYTKLAKKPLEP